MKDSEYRWRYRLQQKCGVIWRDIAYAKEREPFDRLIQSERVRRSKHILPVLFFRVVDTGAGSHDAGD